MGIQVSSFGFFLASEKQCMLNNSKFSQVYGSIGLDLNWKISFGFSNGGAGACCNDFPQMGILGLLSLFMFGSENPSLIL